MTFSYCRLGWEVNGVTSKVIMSKPLDAGGCVWCTDVAKKVLKRS